MSPTASAIRYWLLKRPRAVTVRAHCGKDVQEIDCSGGRVSWARIAETLDTLDATRIDLLDATGKLIRATDPAELAEPEEGDDEPAETAPAPADASVVDPETARFKLVANLIAEAYRHSNEVAFARLADIVDRMTRRTESTERSIDHLRRVLIAEAEEKYAQGGGEPSVLEQLAGAFAGGLNLANTPTNGAPPNGAPPNGKH